MSNSGKQIGDCRHGYTREVCETCDLAAEVERLREYEAIYHQLATEHSARNLVCYLNTRGVA